MSVPGNAAEDAVRIRQIFRYLAGVGESRSRPVRTDEGARHQLWLSELPAGTASVLTSEGTGEPVWLRVDRPVRHEPPLIDSLLDPWLDPAAIRKFHAEEPPQLLVQGNIREEAAGDGSVDDGMRTVDLDDYSLQDEVRSAHAQWCTAWLRWASHEREVAPVVALYERLYRIHEDVAALGERFELVLGCGYLTWEADEEPVRRHLVTARAVLNLDQHTGTLTLEPDPEAGSLLLDESMLDAAQKARSATRESILALLDEAGDLSTPEQLTDLHEALKTWAIAAHESGSYRPTIVAHRPSSLSAPTVSFAPSLLLRERTRRTLLDVLNRIAERIEQGAVPTELLRFIAGEEADATSRTNAVDGSLPDGSVPEETYFALPSNEEQRTIAERMRNRRLVVVQGPPGTGKTHTIANLVTDLLAHDQRVLITSHTARALKVLKSKLPPGVRELCVSRTDDGLAAQQELEGSIRAILDRQGSYNPRDYQRQIDEHERRLKSARSAQALALSELRAIREQETYRHPADIGDYSGTLQTIAQRLAEERKTYSWLGSVPSPQPLLTASQVQALRRLAAAFTPAHRALANTVATVPEAADLPGPGTFEQAVSAIRAADDVYAQTRNEASVAHLEPDVSRLSAERQMHLAALVDDFARTRVVAEATALPWASALRDEVLAGNDWTLRSRLERTESALAAAEAAHRALGASLVVGVEHFDLSTALGKANVLRQGLVAGEKLRGAMGIKTKLRKAVGEFVDAVQVDGQAPEDLPRASAVLNRVVLERHLQDLEAEWGDGVEAWQPPVRRLARIRQEADVLRKLAALADSRTALQAGLGDVPALAAAPWHDALTVAGVQNLLRAHAAWRSAQDRRAMLKNAAETLQLWCDRPGAPLALLTRGHEAVTALNSAAWADLCVELADLREALRLKSERDAAYAAVAAVLPEVAEAIDTAPEQPMWDERLPHLERAWAWSAWSQRMRDLTDPSAEEKQRRSLAEADSEIRIALERLSSDRAWHACLRRLTDAQAVALTSYQQSVRRLGKGTGKYAARYRSQARESLRECQDAVPAWIMPLYQVTETVPSDLAGRFDVVIIDEASQSGPEALLLAWLGAKIVVVGDDKQVSPANVGMNEQELFHLQSRLLGGLPASRRNLFTPKASFFDIASGLAGGTGRIMLREHFRCMPEIIGFSNQLCYGGKLQPLRQYGADRLPPVRTVHVPNGYVEGTGQKQINRLEAEQLVDQLVRCCADPAYDGRTMGVITLLGAAQKFYIEDQLAERLPLATRQARQLRVGDAEDFQGDERDVMFLSTVVSLTNAQGPHRPGAFSGDMYQQRINVAASRARDQVWVFHSFALSDLGETDLRRHYLDYLSRPAEQQDGLGLDDVAPNERHDAFDSLFEQRVFLALRRRGFRVIPQYPAGRFRIDLVVEGGSKRLAVECDGDAFHNEENAEADAARQRELERVGWTFVRIRGSRFSLDPDAALEPLWAELNRLGIDPHGEKREGTHASSVALPTSVPAGELEPDVTPIPEVPLPVESSSPGSISSTTSFCVEDTVDEQPVQSAEPLQPERPERPHRSEQPERAERSAHPARSEQPERTERPARSVPPARPKPIPGPATSSTPEAEQSPPESIGTWVPVPNGFRSVGWIRRYEAQAAVRAFSSRIEIPIVQGGRLTGNATLLPRAGVPGLPGIDVVEVTRGAKTMSLLPIEAQALLRCSNEHTDVPVLLDGKQIGLVQYFPPESAESQRFRSTMRLLRRGPGLLSRRADR